MVKSGRIRKKEMELRQMAFWSGFVHDQYDLFLPLPGVIYLFGISLWSVSLGRPTSIKNSDVTVPPLSPLHASFDLALLAAWVELCKIQGSISDFYNGPKLRPTADTIKMITSFDQNLTRWLDELSDRLRWDCCANPDLASSLCILHLHYCATRIVLHRPLAAYRRVSQSPLLVLELNEISPGGLSRSNSRAICATNAMQIGNLSAHILDKYGAKNMSTICNRITFIAATTMLLHLLAEGNRPGSDCNEGRNCLTNCVRVLGALANRYLVAGNSRTVLSFILEKSGIKLSDNIESTVLDSGFNTQIGPTTNDVVDDLSLDLNWFNFISTFESQYGFGENFDCMVTDGILPAT